MKDWSSRIDEEFDKILFQESPLAEDIPSEEMYASISKSIRRRKAGRIAGVAAAIAVPIVFLICSGWYLQNSYGIFDTSAKEYVVEAGVAETVQAVFQEGSRVYLNAGSKLVYPEKFGLKSRDVRLDGEAYFEVSPDSRKPFVVDFESGSVRVYGTKFNVKAYSAENKFVVSLDEGSVKVVTGQKEFMMVPSDVLVCDNGRIAIHHGSDSGKNSLWRQSVISFREGTASEVFAQLSRMYGVDFVVQGFIPDYKFTFTTEKDSLKHILDELELISSLNFRYDGNARVIVSDRH